MAFLGSLLMAGAIYGLRRLLEPDRKKPSPTYDFDQWETTSERDRWVPIVYGRHRVTGNYIFRDQGAGIQYDAAVALCEGPIEGIDAGSVFVDGKSMVVDLVDGGCECHTYTGTADQTHDPWFEAGSFSFVTIRDAGTNEQFPDTESIVNRVRLETGEYTQIFYVKFDISRMPSGITVTKAVIEMNYRAGFFQPGRVGQAQECDTTWPNDVTWNDHPAVGTTRSTYAFHENNPSADTITDSSAIFLDDGFKAGMIITVAGSSLNDGTYTVDTVTAGTMTLTTGVELADESAGSPIRIAPSSGDWAPHNTLHVNRELHVTEIVKARYEDSEEYVSFAVMAMTDGLDWTVDSLEQGASPPTLRVEYTCTTPSAYRHLAYLALRLKAGPRLSGGSEHTVTAVVDGLRVRQWDTDTEEWVTAWTRNPAWIILDILTNSRWDGALVDEWIDLESFKDAAAYFDATVTVGGGTESRACCDIVFDSEISKAAAIEQVLKTCGGWLIRKQGKHVLLPEKAVTSTHDFDTANIALESPEVDGASSFTYEEITHTNRPNRIEVEFLNAEKDCEKDYATEDDEDDWDERGIVPLTAQLYGITRRSQACRMARLLLWKYKLQRYRATVRGGIGSTSVIPGDVVRITHPVAGWTDREFRVTMTREHFNDEIDLELEEYNASLYDDTGKPYTPPQESRWEHPRRIPPNVENLTLTETAKQLDDGTYLPRIKVTFDRPGYMDPLRFLVYWRKGTDPWEPMIQIDDFTSETIICYIDAVETGAYTVKVLTENIYTGVRSTNPPTEQITVAGKQTVPATPGAPTLSAIAGGLVISWTAVEEADIIGYNVYVDTSSSATTFRALINGTSWAFHGLGNQLYYVRITAVNSAGESGFSTEASETTLDIGDFEVDSIQIPLLSDFTWTTNSRAEWTAGKLTFEGTIYNIVSGYTTLAFIYWDRNSSNTTFQASAIQPDTTGNDKWLIAYYDSVGDEIKLAMGIKILHGGMIEVRTVDADRIVTKSLTVAEIDESTIPTSGIDNDAGWTQGATWGVDIGNEPADLADINAGEGSKLAGIEAGADVTGNNTAKDIVNLPDTPSSAGFYADGSKLGFHDGTEWMVYIENASGQGRFYFKGDGSNFVTWDGTTLTVRGAINADDIDTGTLTGRTVRTASSGQRIELDQSDNTLRFYASGGTNVLTIDDGVGPGLGVGIDIDDGFNTASMTTKGINIESGYDVVFSAKALLGGAEGQTVIQALDNTGGSLFYVSANGVGYFDNVVTVSTPTSSSHAATKQYVDDNAGVSDHGALSGLGDDDHAQYLNVARHDTTTRHALGSVVPHDSHGSLSGIGVNDHHNRQHDLDSVTDHGVDAADQGKFLKVNSGTPAPQWRAPADVRADIGAAASSHPHGAADITSGKLAIARGGTNNDGFTQDRVLYFDGAKVASMSGGKSGTYNVVEATGENPGTTNKGFRYRQWTLTNGVVTAVSAPSWSDDV